MIESATEYIDGLHGCNDDLDTALRILSEDLLCAEAGRRAHIRHAYAPKQGVRIDLQQPGGTVSRFLVRAHDLADGGVGLLIGSFVYVGTKCAVTLISHDGELVRLTGRATHCRNLRGRVHYIGVKFDRIINAAAMLGLPSDAARDESVHPYEPEYVMRLARQFCNLAAEGVPPGDLWEKLGQIAHAIGYELPTGVVATPGPAGGSTGSTASQGAAVSNTDGARRARSASRPRKRWIGE